MSETEVIKIIADAAETRSGIIARLSKMAGYQVETRVLESGDYLVGEGVIIERRVAVDFYASILDGRFVVQGKLMTESYGRMVYIIEGDLTATPHNFSQASLHGALSYLSVLEGISIVPSAGVAETASLVATMARHCQQGLGYIPPLRIGKAKGGETAKLFIIEGIPGVGAQKARTILSHFGSVAKVFGASRTEWLAVPGLGKAIVDRVFAVIHE